MHRRAPKPSGGVGILVKKWVVETYEISIVDKSYDGILALKFDNHDIDTSVIVFSCYLPPENSVWGRDSQSFFAHLLALIYTYENCDFMFIGADFNARIGSLSDVLEDCDSIPPRVVLDKKVNQHGHSLIEFLNDTKFCVLNNRFSHDNYTSISVKGRAVVDYMCVPQDIFVHCKSFTVLTINEIVEKNNLHGLIGERSRLPDHSALLGEFDLGITDNSSFDCGTHANIDHTSKQPRFKLKQIPNDFMESDMVKSAIFNLIDRIERCRETQGEIDAIYDNLCKLITREMHDKIPQINASSRTQRRRKHLKPYWNDELQSLWYNMNTKERAFLKCDQNNRYRQTLHNEYIGARNDFDKLLRQCERAYRYAKAIEIEEMSTSNPNDFWQKIKSLGPRKDSSIPIEIIDENGTPIRNEHEVWNRWKSDFEKLYNGTDTGNFDDIHYRQCLNHKEMIERRNEDPLYTPNALMNRNISIEEISSIIMKAKSGSAQGFDRIPYDVLKFLAVIAVLKELFQLIFDCSIIPSIWRKSIIFPILKDPNTDKRVPLNYRGISLLSCVNKLYTAFINKRVSGYMESNNLMADEQNGFRKGRSCEDHIFTLNSIVRNNKNTFTAFIDLRKCFDFVDRGLLLYKLLLNNVDGRVYHIC
ncbi:uncharacterized protein LOC132717406 [Ruditapes philippinarum]|uniref:uncharacterized protein LOC132717406 n=1 Tax=Ruditapes philippinarum TaxID=129788 RepID=UPI00295BA64C|nr:uncharacterized protein LOC132717406 [Ruditapes philippinarum]